MRYDANSAGGIGIVYRAYILDYSVRIIFYFCFVNYGMGFELLGQKFLYHPLNEIIHPLFFIF